MSPGPSVTVKNSSAINPLCLFNEVFDVKNKTANLRVGAAKSKQNENRAGNMLW